MADVELHRLRSQVDSAFDRIGEIDPQATQLRAEYARYLCVRTSGLIEASVRRIFSQYSITKASPAVGRYAAANVERLQNVSSDKVFQLVGAFDPAWREALEAFVVGERKDAIDSIVANRNAISHGNPTGITFATVRRYYELVVEVLDYLEAEYAA